MVVFSIPRISSLQDVNTVDLMTKTVISGFNSLKRLLKNERARFARAPILLIESQANTRDGKLVHASAVSDACRHVNFLLSQQMGFRTVVAHPQSKYVFPSLADIQQASELAARVGASTVAAVGSGGAMDLAKAVAQSHISVDEVLLVPATYGATLAAATAHSLLLDPVEETLLVHPGKNLKLIPTTAILLEGNLFSLEEKESALYANLSVCLDAVYRDVSNAEALLTKALDCFENHDDLTGSLAIAGESLSFGLDGQLRSIPVALAASLIPQDFPQHSILSFLASLAPSLYQLLKGKVRDELLQSVSELLSSAPQMVTTESTKTMLQHIHGNKVLWKSYDVQDSVYRFVLERHSLTQ